MRFVDILESTRNAAVDDWRSGPVTQTGLLVVGCYGISTGMPVTVALLKDHSRLDELTDQIIVVQCIKRCLLGIV